MLEGSPKKTQIFTSTVQSREGPRKPSCLSFRVSRPFWSEATAEDRDSRATGPRGQGGAEVATGHSCARTSDSGRAGSGRGLGFVCVISCAAVEDCFNSAPQVPLLKLSGVTVLKDSPFPFQKRILTAEFK